MYFYADSPIYMGYPKIRMKRNHMRDTKNTG